MVFEEIFEMALLIAMLFVGGPIVVFMMLWMYVQRIKCKQELGLRQREIWYDEDGHKHW